MAGTLGYGEQRLLEIAITLATRPVILLLDEPLAGLPETERSRIAQLIKQLAMRYAILLIEHDIDRVIEISDRVTVMHEGRVIADGSPAEIQENPMVQQAYLGRTATTQTVGAPEPVHGREVRPFLVLEKVNTFYGDSHILHDVSLTIGRNEMACLLGRNGSGKTTTLRSIMGVTRVRSGQIILDDKEMQALPTHQIAQQGIAIVPEGARIFPNLTVFEHLLMAARQGRPGSWNIPRILDFFPNLETSVITEANISQEASGRC